MTPMGTMNTSAQRLREIENVLTRYGRDAGFRIVFNDYHDVPFCKLTWWKDRRLNSIQIWGKVEGLEIVLKQQDYWSGTYDERVRDHAHWVVGLLLLPLALCLGRVRWKSVGWPPTDLNDADLVRTLDQWKDELDSGWLPA
jgi:hypothetical protein